MIMFVAIKYENVNTIQIIVGGTIEINIANELEGIIQQSEIQELVVLLHQNHQL